MKTSMKLFLPAVATLLTLISCDSLLNNGSDDLQNDILENIQGHWESSHVVGPDGERDIVPSEDDDMSFRIKFTESRMTIYNYEGIIWVESINGTYTVKGNMITFAREVDGETKTDEIEVLSIKEHVVEIRIKPEGSNDSYDVTLLRFNEEDDEKETLEEILRNIQGNWLVIRYTTYESSGELSVHEGQTPLFDDDSGFLRIGFDDSMMYFSGKDEASNWVEIYRFEYRVSGMKLLLEGYDEDLNLLDLINPELILLYLGRDLMKIGFVSTDPDLGEEFYFENFLTLQRQ